MKEKEYRVIATSWKYVKNNIDYSVFLELALPSEIESYKKWKGKKIKLSEIPKFVKDEGRVILDKNTIEIFDTYE